MFFSSESWIEAISDVIDMSYKQGKIWNFIFFKY